MSRRITLLNQDHEWLVGMVESMLRKAKKEASIWCDYLNQIERVKDALYTADPGFDELFPDEPPEPVEVPVKTRSMGAKQKTFTAPKAKVAPKVEAPVAKKVRAKRGERLATLPNLCPTHPAYAAVRRPKTLDCEGCWSAFKRNRSAGEYAKARDAVEKKG